eukprot:SAG31_NODE_1321_length_8801_cov_7.086532_2_plen_89_part_00
MAVRLLASGASLALHPYKHRIQSRVRRYVRIGTKIPTRTEAHRRLCTRCLHRRCSAPVRGGTPSPVHKWASGVLAAPPLATEMVAATE